MRAFRTFGAAGLGAFGVHKAALTVLTKTRAIEEICDGITLNMVAPGSTQGAGTLLEEARIPVKNTPWVVGSRSTKSLMQFFTFSRKTLPA